MSFAVDARFPVRLGYQDELCVYMYHRAVRCSPIASPWLERNSARDGASDKWLTPDSPRALCWDRITSVEAAQAIK